MAEIGIEITNLERLIDIFGVNDVNADKIEREFDVKIVIRSGEIRIIGDGENVARAEKVIRYLDKYSSLSGKINDQTIEYALKSVRDGEDISAEKLINNTVLITSRGKPIRPKTLGQKNFIEAIRNNTITFGVGPAGTGKTFLSVALATLALRNNTVSRIVITRPAVEAGERLGFLPGDLQSKIDPYLRPLYDALFEMLGAENFQRLQEKGTIEVAPLAYMRGRTLDDSFIILDEAQNTPPEQMKMFLTRLGFNSKAVINGDTTQIDLPPNVKSGLVNAIEVCEGIEGVEIFRLSSKDIVRNPIVSKIVESYEKHEKKQKESKAEKKK